MASPLDPSLYAWSAHPGKPNLYLRRALGVENKWVREALARQNQVLLYLYGELSFKNPIQISKFVERARCAWMRLRWLHPEVCLGPYLPNAHGSVSGMDDEESRKMCCPVPSSHEEVMAWAKATLSFDFERNNAFLGLRERVAELRKDRVPPVVLRFAASGEQVVGENKMLIKVQYAFCVDHSCTDGIGMYLIAGIYLALLAEQLSDSAPKNLDWASCVDNLPVPWVRILNREQRTGGVELEKSVIALRGQIDEYLKVEWGLGFHEARESYEPAWLHLPFSEDTTAALLRECKGKLGISITHLGQAATVIAALKRSEAVNLPPGDGLMCSLFMNGRRYLDLDNSKSKTYLPMCRAMGFIKFDRLDEVSLSSQASQAETQKALNYACHQARDSYQRIRDQKSILTESFTGSDYLSSAFDNVGFTRAQPIFISDGVLEQYLQQVYYDGSKTREVFTILGVEFVADPSGPSPVVRISTFRNQLRLSAEWNKACYHKDEIEDFTREVYQLMKSII